MFLGFALRRERVGSGFLTGRTVRGIQWGTVDVSCPRGGYFGCGARTVTTFVLAHPVWAIKEKGHLYGRGKKQRGLTWLVIRWCANPLHV